MPEIVFAIPVLPGKEELDRNTLDEMAGSRRDEYEALLKEAGVTRQAVWHPGNAGRHAGNRVHRGGQS